MWPTEDLPSICPALAELLMTLTQCRIEIVKDQPVTNFKDVMIDQYLLWSERASLEDVKTEAPANLTHSFEDTLRVNVQSWTVCVTKRGSFGMIPVHAKADDVVVILCGGAAPFVIRNAGGGNWRIAGPSMFGEFITSETYKYFDGRFEKSEFSFV